MKRVLTLMLALCLIFSGCGAQKTNGQGNQVLFYYEQRGASELTADSMIASESRNTYAGALGPVLELYFRGPKQDSLISPFPDGTEVISVSQENGTTELTLSNAFFSLQGVNLAVACACLTQTVCAYTGELSMTLSDELGRIHMELAPDSFLIQDKYQTDTDQMFTLYFPSEDRRYVIPELREATLSENETAEAYLLRELLAGPQTSGLQAAMPDETEILGVSTNGGICTVDLSGAFYDNAFSGDYGLYTAIYSIVDTLTGLDSVDSVIFLKDGASIGSSGIMLLGEPITRDARVIGPVHNAGGEVDVNLYTLQRISGDPFAVPVRVRQQVSAPTAEAVLNDLLGFIPPQGFYNPVPFGTELLSVSVSGSVCYVDLSREFVPGNDTEKREREAVWALVQTLTGLDSINSVALTIEGEAGGLSYVDLSEPLTRKMVRLH